MKIAVVGCGAVGSYYGARLVQAGHQVHFLLRSDYETVRQTGVSIRSPQGDLCVHPHCAKAPEEIGPVELVLVGLKTTANDQFACLLPPLVGPATAILTLQNGLGNEEQLARLFPPSQVLGGLCFVCLNRLEPGLIRHFDHGLIVVGEFQRQPEARTRELAALFERAGIRCKVTDNLEHAHWEKLVWNIPFNGLGVAASAGYELLASAAETGEITADAPSNRGGQREIFRSLKIPGTLGPCWPTDQLLSDARWEQLVRDLMSEVIAAARSLGFLIPEAFAETNLERTRTMGAYRASTLIDFERGQPLELESLFLEPLRRARCAGVPTPRLAALAAVLQALDRSRAQGRG